MALAVACKPLPLAMTTGLNVLDAFAAGALDWAASTNDREITAAAPATVADFRNLRRLILSGMNQLDFSGKPGLLSNQLNERDC